MSSGSQHEVVKPSSHHAFSYFTDAALKQLEDHKYVAGGSTPLESYVMNPFWNWTASFVPKVSSLVLAPPRPPLLASPVALLLHCCRTVLTIAPPAPASRQWLAPNLITLCGSLCTLGGYFLMLQYSPDLRGVAPTWVYLVLVLSVFAYQTLDAIDGKHARNTKSGSPLGQLFDHGCDAGGAAFLALTIAMAIQLGPNYKVVALMLAIQLPFFLAQWEEYHLHVLRTNVGVVGVTEGQIFMMGIYGATAAWGPGIWTADVSAALGAAPGTLLGHDVLLLSFLTQPLFLAAVFVKSVLFSSEGRAQRAAAVAQLAPALCLAVFTVLWSTDPSPTALFKSHPQVMLLTCGLCCTYITTYMIICSITRMAYPSFMSILAPAPAVFVMTYLEGAQPARWLGVPNQVLLYAYLLFVVFMYLHFVCSAIYEITSYLGIYTFRIGVRCAPTHPAKLKRLAEQARQRQQQ